MKKILLSFVWQLAVLVTVFSAFGSLSSANASDVLKLGDVDGNGSVNVVDITVLVNYLRTPSTVKINTTTADANRDGKVNAADEAAIANIILSGTPDQSANSILFFAEATVEKAFGNAISNPVVLAGSTGAVTYSASPASVATVNATTGEVTCVGAGQATVTATLAASGKLKGATAQFTLKVVKSTSTNPDDAMKTKPEAKTAGSGGNPTYTGSAQPLITAGESAGGTIYYKVTTTNQRPSKSDPGWTTEVPTGTDAGTYYVWYYTKGNDNIGETDVCTTPVTVTIGKGDGTIDPAQTMTTPVAAKTAAGGGNPTYTGSAQPLITPGESSAGTIRYKVTTTNTPPSKSDAGWSTSVPEATDAGTYYVWYYAEGNGNCEATAVSKTPVTVTIDKASATIDPAQTMTTPVAARTSEGGGGLPYTGSTQNLVTPGESKAGTVYYKVTTTNTQPSKSDSGWSTSVPTGTDAGTYYVWYYAEGNGNYSETAVCATPVTVTIDKSISTSTTITDWNDGGGSGGTLNF